MVGDNSYRTKTDNNRRLAEMDFGEEVGKLARDVTWLFINVTAAVVGARTRQHV